MVLAPIVHNFMTDTDWPPATPVGGGVSRRRRLRRQEEEQEEQQQQLYALVYEWLQVKQE